MSTACRRTVGARRKVCGRVKAWAVAKQRQRTVAGLILRRFSSRASRSDGLLDPRFRVINYNKPYVVI